MNIDRLFHSFPRFLEELWKARGYDRFAPLGMLEYDLAEYAANGPAKRVVLAFRGVGKTHLVAGGLVAWRAFRDPQRQFIIVSKNVDAAKKTVRLIRGWMDNVEFLRHLAPGDDDLDAATYFNFGCARPGERQQSLFCLGVGGQLENNRAHTIIGDDLETKVNSRTPESRDELARLCGEFSNILYPNRPLSEGGAVDPVEAVIIGTPKHDETLYKRMLDEKGYDLRSYPVAYPAPDQKVVNLAPTLAKRLEHGTAKPGDPTCPHRFGLDKIASLQAEGWQEYGREGLLLIDMRDDELYPLRLGDLIVFAFDKQKAPAELMWAEHDHNGGTGLEDPISHGLGNDRLRRPAWISPDWHPFQRTLVWIDPAGSGTDKTAAVAASTLNGRVYIHAVLSLDGGHTPEDMDRLILFARTHFAREVFIESNADTLGLYRRMFQARLPTHFLQPNQLASHPEGWKAGLVEDKALTHVTGQKELRIIDSLRPVLQGHRLVIHPDAIRHKPDHPLQHSLQYQLTRLTKQRKCLAEDGLIDALSGAVRACHHQLGTNPERSAETHRDRLIEQELKRLDRQAWTQRSFRMPGKASKPRPYRW